MGNLGTGGKFRARSSNSEPVHLLGGWWWEVAALHLGCKADPAMTAVTERFILGRPTPAEANGLAPAKSERPAGGVLQFKVSRDDEWAVVVTFDFTTHGVEASFRYLKQVLIEWV
jgi:hypothetical protein